jgi:tight adherence protein B
MARSTSHPRTRPAAPGRRVAMFLVALLACGMAMLAAPAYAATSSIDFVEPDGENLNVVVSLSDVPEGVTPDLGTVVVTFDDGPVNATAETLSDAGDRVRRTVVLAMDVSNSMRGARFEAAQEAANVFLDNVPADVYVGLVTFASDVTVAQEPTQDTEAIREAVAALQLTRQTRLYDGVREALTASGEEGSRSVLVLSDGRDTSGAPVEDVTAAIEEAGVKVDVVALEQGAEDTALLQQLAGAGNGEVINADDPAALGDLFAEEAQALARQLLVTVEPPADLAGREGNLAVTVLVDGEPTTSQAFVRVPGGESVAGGGEVPRELQPVEPGLVIPQEMMYGGLAAAALGVLAIVFIAFGGSRNTRQDAVDRSIEAYTRKGAKKLAEANRQAESSSVTQSAVSVAENVLENQKGLETALGDRLEAAGLALKPAEWLLIHIGVAIGLGVMGLLLGGGNVLYMALGLFFGLALPWLFLSFKRKRRLKAFKAQLADTLQLMAGSLSAGLSLAQSVDTVVREGTDPMAAEFRRALVETRLGVEIEEAMMGIADRMQSVDFEWVVMAIRIQRSVGGNLSELLNKVAETIREREYLERQVLTLSAEGRLSVWILGGLPPGFMAYLLVANPSYIAPMFSNPLGWAMLIIMAVLLTGGIFWMKKLVKVEV